MVIELTLNDALYIAFHMRADDKKEILATRKDIFLNEFAYDCMIWGGWCVRNKSGVPVAMGGVTECWQGVGNAWMVGTDDVPKHGIEITKLTKSVLVNNYHLGRIQAWSAAFHLSSHPWLKSLGFREGARLDQFGKDGEQFIVFEMLKGVDY